MGTRTVLHKNALNKVGIITSFGSVLSISNPSHSLENNLNCLTHLINNQSKNKMQNKDTNIKNLLETTIDSLENLPSIGQREAVFITAAVSYNDLDAIGIAIERAKRNRISISFICLCSDITTCQKIAFQTGGSYSVIDSENQIFSLMMQQIINPKIMIGIGAYNINIGFPFANATNCENQLKKLSEPVATSYHSYSMNKNQGLSLSCSRCSFNLPNLPTSCPKCELFN